MDNTTYLKYQNHGFWIPQYFLEVLSEYICETFENIGITTFSQGLQDIYGDCDSNRKGESIGMVNILFEESVTNSDDEAALINVLDQTKTLLLSKGAELSVTTLEDFESRKADDYFKNTWAFPIKTNSLTATIDIIIQLLNGTWNSDNYGVYYSGFPNPHGIPEI